MKKFNKKTPLIALASLTAVGIIGSTMAYYFNESEFVNNFNTSGSKVITREVFNRNDGDGVTPGEVVNKDIWIDNTGDVPLLVRIKYEENINGKLSSDNATLEYTASNLLSSPSKSNPWIASFKNSNDFKYNNEDNYYYYNGVLEAGASIQHLDSISLWDKFNEGKSTIVEYGYQLTSNGEIQWDNGDNLIDDGKKIKIDDKEYDVISIRNRIEYASSTYSLKVTIETLQATDLNGNNLTDNTLGNVITTWKNITNSNNT